MLTRRSLIGGLFAAAAAPAIVRASSLMQVKPIWLPDVPLPPLAMSNWRAWHAARILNEQFVFRIPRAPVAD